MVSALSSKSVPERSIGGSEDISFSNHSEFRDISRNNGRLWGNLEREAGSKIWKAMEALGVVNNGDEETLIRKIGSLEKEEINRKVSRKESNKRLLC